jgi:hypothetical protein
MDRLVFHQVNSGFHQVLIFLWKFPEYIYCRSENNRRACLAGSVNVCAQLAIIILKMGRNKTIALSVPTHCSQSWERMTENEKGRFCDSCNKSVIDFTNYSDQQLAVFFEKKSGKVCGKMRKDQLDRSLYAVEHNPKYSIPQLLVSAALTIGLGNGAYAKERAATTTVINVVQSDIKEAIEDPASIGGDSTRCISGQVIDMETKETLPGAIVMIEGTTIAVATDMNGSFKLNIPDHLSREVIKVGFYDVGYETQKLKFEPEAVSLNQVIEMKGTSGIMGEVEICRATPWQRLKYRFRKMINHA